METLMEELDLLIAEPVKLNLFKHHATWLRSFIQAAIARGPSGIDMLPSQTVQIGARTMDMYIGPLTPTEIVEGILNHVELVPHLSREAFATLVAASGGYRNVAFVDGSVWTLRYAEGLTRYLHVHPGRHTPDTQRVRGNTLRVAIMVIAHTAIHGGALNDVRVVNEVRRRYLGMHPIGQMDSDAGLASVINMLRMEC